MKKKPRKMIGIVAASMGKTTAPNAAILTDPVAVKSIEQLAAAIRGKGMSVEVCRPPTGADLSGLKALFDGVPPVGDIDDDTSA